MSGFYVFWWDLIDRKSQKKEKKKQIFSKLRITLIPAIVNGELSICGFYQSILQLHSPHFNPLF